MASSVDLSNCDREPIHAPGEIQPFGHLIALDPSARLITHWSRDFADLAGASKSDGPLALADVFDERSSAAFSALRESAPADGALPPLRVALANGGVMRAMPHCQRGRLIVELEPVDDQPPQQLVDYQESVSGFAARLESLRDPQQVCELAAALVKRLTGYDRVMVYRFHEDLHGEVIAETREKSLESWLGLHYPASDIPAPARAIFAANKLRMIPDIDYQPMPIVAASGVEDAPLDLTRSLLRSVSPIHIEYLRNMRVRASLTLSIKQGDRLWGLIACHHYAGPRYAPPSLRSACEILADYVSAAIGLKVEQQGFAARRRAAAVEAALSDQMSCSEHLAAGLVGKRTVLELIDGDCTGVAVVSEAAVTTAGATPPAEEVTRIVGWLRDARKGRIYSTDALGAEYPPAAAYSDVASGMLALMPDDAARTCVLWFKPEVIRTVIWGGDPQKAASIAGRIHPRKSFEAWSETVKGKSRPWAQWELDIASDFLLTLTTEELRRKFESEWRARAEAERANRTKDEFMAVISHDLRNPISSVNLSVPVLRTLLPEDTLATVDATLTSIDRAVAQMRSLVDGLLDVAAIEAGRLRLNLRNVSATGMVADCIAVLRPLAAERRIEIRESWPPGSTEINADYEHLLQVCSNLIGNAIKFTEPGGVVSVSVEENDHSVIYKVVDNGIGIAAEDLPHIFDRFWRARGTPGRGAGLGLAIAKGIVETHGGTIGAESTVGKGSTFWFTIPKP